jgi:hypothetical protein
MNDEPKKKKPEPPPPVKRKPYRPPTLRSLGKVTEMTNAVGSGEARRKPHG